MAQQPNTFMAFSDEWAVLQERAQSDPSNLRDRERLALFETLFGPAQHRWLSATLDDTNPDVIKIDDLKNLLNHLVSHPSATLQRIGQTALLHLRLRRADASVVADPMKQSSPQQLLAEAHTTAKDAGLDQLMVYDLLCSVARRPLQVTASAELTGLLIPEGADLPAIPAQIRFDAVAIDGRALFPAACMAFIARDHSFREAETAAKAAALHLLGDAWPTDTSIRWSMIANGTQPLGFDISGKSLGGAMAIGMMKALSGL